MELKTITPEQAQIWLNELRSKPNYKITRKFLMDKFYKKYPFVEHIDLDIAYEALILNINDIQTSQSCQGTKGHGHLEPTVWFGYGGGMDLGYKGYSVALANRLSIKFLRLTFNINDSDGLLRGPWWELVFKENRIRPSLEQWEWLEIDINT